MVSHVADLGNELARRGHNVTILAPCTQDRPSCALNDLELISFGRSFSVPTQGSIAHVSFSIWRTRRLKALLQAERFDIVHVHEPLIPWVSFTATRNSTSPTVGTFHAYNEGVGRWYARWKSVLRRSFEKLGGLIAVSEPAATFAGRYFPGDYNIIPNGIDVDRFASPCPRPSVMRDDAINLLFVGRISEKRKGLKYLLGAYSRLKWDYPNLRLIVAGPGVPDPDSYRLMGERGIEDVIFAGPIPHEELPGYYQAADIFCSPATGRESFGYVLAEAMAASTPVVATDIPGFRSSMDHGQQGLLVQPRSERALAEGIRSLIEDPAMRLEMSVNARAKADEYRWDSVASRVLEQYRAAQQGHNASPVPLN